MSRVKRCLDFEKSYPIIMLSIAVKKTIFGSDTEKGLGYCEIEYRKNYFRLTGALGRNISYMNQRNFVAKCISYLATKEPSSIVLFNFNCLRI